MRAIPMALRKKIAGNPFMSRCYRCGGHPEWEHALIYAGKQINEWWAIIPCCEYHHRGQGLNKDLNRLYAILRGGEEKQKYAKENWAQLESYLRWKCEEDLYWLEELVELERCQSRMP